VGEVEPETFRFNQRSCLLDMLAENLTESRLKEVRSSVVPCCRGSLRFVYLEVCCISGSNDPGFNDSTMDNKVCERSKSVEYLQMCSACRYGSGIS